MPERDQRLVAGRYALQSVLGRGGMGTVWLAGDTVSHRQVAIKEIAADGRVSSRTPGDLVGREARAAIGASHPCVVRVLDVVREADRAWLVMEALPGENLDEAIRRDGRLPVERVAHVGLCLLAALRAAHRAGVIHRDVKPSNVQLCGGNRVVLTDFGVAAVCGVGTAGWTSPLAGSRLYMAPEAISDGACGPAADYFSLGATLATAVEGRPPFATGTRDGVGRGADESFPHAGPLRGLIRGLLAEDPACRPGPHQINAVLRAVVRGPRPPAAR